MNCPHEYASIKWIDNKNMDILFNKSNDWNGTLIISANK